MNPAIACDWESWLTYGLSVGLLVGLFVGQWAERRKGKR